MEFFPHSDEFTSYRMTVDWMKKLCQYGGISMRRTEQDAPTLSEIKYLTDKTSLLEEELLGLVAQLQKVDVLKKKTGLLALKPQAI